MDALAGIDLDGIPLYSRGKVRDMFEIEGNLLIVTTDRMSAFDVIMSEPIPGKGVILNQITVFWMKRFAPLVKNHLLAVEAEFFPPRLKPYAHILRGRAVLARKASPLPVECIVRGHLAGSAWEEYKKLGTVCGLSLPAGLRESSRLDQPLFTPSTKAAQGEHDENITPEKAASILGQDVFDRVRDLSLRLFGDARDYAESRGIIIADTKFEFGLLDGEIILIDEVLTPDSSRFWPLKGYAPGRGQPSFDKQYLRDWLSAQNWDKNPPPPALPRSVIDETAKKYKEAYRILTGKEKTS
jgi:phosphoribosylaminoimidazole-succinocarboxamide synthase